MSERFPALKKQGVKRTAQKMLVYGIQGSGITHYAKELLKKHNYTTLCFQFHKHDLTNEPDNFIYFKPSQQDQFGNPLWTKEDFARFCVLAQELAKRGQIDGLAIDEMDLLFRNNWDIMPEFNSLIINHRHYDCFLLGITRRPQDIPAKFVSQTHKHIIFSFDEPLAKKKFNDIYKGLGDDVARLEYKKYGCYIKEIGSPPYKSEVYKEYERRSNSDVYVQEMQTNKDDDVSGDTSEE